MATGHGMWHDITWQQEFPQLICDMEVLSSQSRGSKLKSPKYRNHLQAQSRRRALHGRELHLVHPQTLKNNHCC
jgi:hypothetical protein